MTTIFFPWRLIYKRGSFSYHPSILSDRISKTTNRHDAPGKADPDKQCAGSPRAVQLPATTKYGRDADKTKDRPGLPVRHYKQRHGRLPRQHRGPSERLRLHGRSSVQYQAHCPTIQFPAAHVGQPKNGLDILLLGHV